jgi:hypothetical protein
MHGSNDGKYFSNLLIILRIFKLSSRCKIKTAK